MANLCDFRMLIKGKKENIEAFLDALEQKGDTYIGRGCVVDIDLDDESAFVNGYTKWSINASLISDANSMKASKEAVVNGTGKSMWFFGEGKDIKDINFLTVFEACEKFSVNMEVYSQEEGCEFQEHLKYENGEITNEATEWHVEYDEDMNQIGTSGGFVDNIYDGVDFEVCEVEEKTDLER